MKINQVTIGNLMRDMRTIHLYVAETTAGVIAYGKTTLLPIKKTNQAFFIIIAKWWVSGFIQDNPIIPAGSKESISASLQTAGVTAMGDWSQPQTIDMYRRYLKRHSAVYDVNTGGAGDPQQMYFGNYEVIESAGPKIRFVLQPVPYQKVRLAVKSTNSSDLSEIHCRIQGIILDLEPTEWAFLTSQFGRYR